MVLDRVRLCYPIVAAMKGPTENEKRVTLFENLWLEKLTVLSVTWFVVIWAVLIPLIVLTAWGTASPMAAAGLVLAGLLVWSLFEYVAHRYLFHWQTRWLPAKQFVFVIHGNHHAQMRDHLRNLMPPIVSIPVSMTVWAIFVVLAGSAGTWLFLGFISGYLAYDFTHYACHQFPMRGPFGRMLKRHHMRHHFSDNEGNFAITAIFWDRVFGSHIGAVGKKGSAEKASEPAPHPAE